MIFKVLIFKKIGQKMKINRKGKNITFGKFNIDQCDWEIYKISLFDQFKHYIKLKVVNGLMNFNWAYKPDCQNLLQ